MLSALQLVQGLYILNYRFLYSAYADDSTFSLHNIDSVMGLARTFKQFSSFSDLSSNMSKCEIAVVWNCCSTTVCNMKNIVLIKESFKTTRISVAYNKTIQNELNFAKTISKIEALLKLWRIRTLSLERENIEFKSLALSSLIFLFWQVSQITPLKN